MTRIVINKPKNKICEMCQNEYSLYSFSSHLKFSHNISANDYALKYGEYRKPEKTLKRSIQKVTCAICQHEYSAVGMFVHLRDSHGINSIDEYVKTHGEFRLKKIMHANREKNTENKLQCAICKVELLSERYLSYHVRLEHSMDKIDYI